MKSCYWSHSRSAWTPVADMHTNHLTNAAKKLEAELLEHPENASAEEQLSDIKAELAKRAADAQVAEAIYRQAEEDESVDGF